MAYRIPSYFDGLIEAFHRQRTGRFVHLGHWDDPRSEVNRSKIDSAGFDSAQARMNAILVGMADIEPGQSVLDVGCGFGGTLASINEHCQDVFLTGVNIDPRQLEICRQIVPLGTNRLAWELGDACRLPFTDQTFDRVLCIEAMFHFPSRRTFFTEAARVLRPGGLLVITDIVMTPDLARSGLPGFAIEAMVQDGFGPWPDFWGADADHAGLARSAGLLPAGAFDATAHTLPSHRYTLPPDVDDARDTGNAALRAALMLAWLHKQGFLRYLYFRFASPEPKP